MLRIFVLLLINLILQSVCATFWDEKPFLWGVATAAYQIEGGQDGKGPNIWDEFALLPGKISNGDTADIADDSYHKYLEDVELLKEMNVKAYRFSISWSRILPFGKGEINQSGIEYYNKLINLLIEANIEPVVTLYHWDLPQSLHAEYNGWLSKQIEQDFLEYANICFNSFGDRVKIWSTMNEPWSFTFLGYGEGAFAPGRCSDRTSCAEGDSATEPYIVAHNILNTHSLVVELYRNKYQKLQNGKIGFVLNIDYATNLTNSIEDIEAANRHNEFQLAWFSDPIHFGHYPQSMIDRVGSRLPQFTEEEKLRLIGSIDYFALNHYTSWYTYNDPSLSQYQGWPFDQETAQTKYDTNHIINGLQAESVWLTVVPKGLYDSLLWITNRYTINNIKPMIIITENGCDVPNESNLSINEIINDNFRINFFQLYLNELNHAIEDGMNIKGYFAWSLLDNFEWKDGFTPRFGMNFVNYTDPNRTRIPKNSSKWYKEYILSHNNYGYHSTDNKYEDNENDENNNIVKIDQPNQIKTESGTWIGYVANLLDQQSQYIKGSDRNEFDNENEQ